MREIVVLLIFCAVFSLVNCDWPCLYSPPCTCDYVGRSADCSHKGLTSVPPILNSLTHMQWHIDLSFNNITRIEDGAFGDLTLSSLEIDHNQINYIGENIFRGSEDTVFSLYLHFNNLEDLPPALGKLTQLYELTIHGNPISKFDTSVLSSTAQSLNRLSYGSSALKSWPYEMKKLPMATWVTIYGIDIETIPQDAFPDDLFILNLTGSSVRSFSKSFHNMSRFYELDLQDDQSLTAEGLAGAGFQNLPKLRTLSIINCGLNMLPPIFDQMTDFGELIIKQNPIKSIADSTFPKNFTTMWQMTIQDTLLDHVPTTFSHLPKLMNMFLQNNKITTISETDFRDMFEMYNLYLSGNPISSISDNAFKSLRELGFMNLDNTLMTTVPKAIQNTPDLNTLYMNNSRVECSCNSLGWMKNWLPGKKRRLQVIGMCYNIAKSINDFIVNDVPKCQ